MTQRPQRIQLRRTAGWRMPANTIKVARPTCWGNPFRIGMVGVPDAAAAVALFTRMIERSDLAYNDLLFVFRPEQLQVHLGGRNLACFCRLDQPCHADVLLRLANPAAA